MSTPEGNKPRDYSRYDQMSTAELEQLLRLDFQASEDGDSDLDAILYISDLLAKRNGPFDTNAAWEQFQAKYRPYADGRSLYDFDGEGPAPSTAKSRSSKRLRRLAILAAVLIACLVGAMAVAQAAGVDLWGAIAQWTDETFRFVSVGASDAAATGDAVSGESQENAGTSQAVLQSLGMEDLFPTWYPDGFRPGTLEVQELHSSVSVHTTFFEEDRNYSVVVEHFLEPQDNTGTFEKDDTPVEEYEHNGETFYILSNLDSLTATTFDGEYMTMIYGQLTREEIKSIIDSIPGPQAAENRAQIQESLAQVGQALHFPQIQEGFVRCDSDYYVEPYTHSINWFEVYVREDEYLTFGLTINIGSPRATYLKDDGPVEEYVYHGNTHYLFHNSGTAVAVWNVENTEYYTWASEGIVDLKELIRSTYEA